MGLFIHSFWGDDAAVSFDIGRIRQPVSPVLSGEEPVGRGWSVVACRVLAGPANGGSVGFAWLKAFARQRRHVKDRERVAPK
jgi:hypothetical protein